MSRKYRAVQIRQYSLQNREIYLSKWTKKSIGTMVISKPSGQSYLCTTRGWLISNSIYHWNALTSQFLSHRYDRNGISFKRREKSISGIATKQPR